MNICVFCGSSMGFDKSYRKFAHDLADYLAAHDLGLVYGGANVGLMKVLADRMLEKGKPVIGIMPARLVRKEVAHQALTEMIIVDTMAERKERMVALSDAFVALPGGFGTLDELSEIMTFNQLRICDKPMGILNVKGFFDHLLRFFDHAVDQGFIRKEHRDNLVVSQEIDTLFQRMNAYKPLMTGKWIKDIKIESNP
ncbi:MAG: TIGR00730 family Rossman fold protein [bacterium]|jgi:uncharacterized protein (TIGR00730 family)